MEGISDRRSRRTFTDACKARSWQVRRHQLRASEARASGPRQGCQRFGGYRERTEEDAAREPGAARRSGSGVVKRQVLQSPSSWAQAQGEGARRKPRRDAGNERGASARSRKQWEAEVGRTHRARAPRTVARQAGGGRVSPSQTARSAGAEGSSPSLQRTGGEGRRSRVPRGAGSSPQRSWVRPAPERNGAQASSLNVTGTA